MALSLNQTVALKEILKPGMRVAAMGYPDIVAPMEVVSVLLGEKLPELQYREDSGVICKRHGLALRKIPDAESLFRLLGCKLDVYDVVQERGCEILCDLNTAWNHAYPENHYDVVLDVGTAEHCFNIGHALLNMAAMVKEGGYIIHENPFNCGNHGFYNLNPTLFVDFYEANGFKVSECKLVSRDGEAQVPHTKRFRFTQQEVNTYAMAQRVEVRPFVFPVQSKYAAIIPAAGVRAEQPKEVANG